jgi:hypothetical protein
MRHHGRFACALSTYCSGAVSRTIHDLADRLPLSLEEVLYRIAQEALHNVVKHAGVSNTPGQARYAAAVLFDIQLTPWSIDGAPDPHADRVHIHLESSTPSLCGSRYHQREDPFANVLILSELRAGLASVPKGAPLCAVCVSSIDRSLQQGDAIRNTAGGRDLRYVFLDSPRLEVVFSEQPADGGGGGGGVGPISDADVARIVDAVNDDAAKRMQQ